jgi:putative lipoprotein
MHVVTGTIVFGADLEPFTGATVHARIEDVSRADAPAGVAAESVLREVGAGGKAPGWLAFTIEAPFLEPRARYVVRVHVDVDVDGQVGVGDYVSTASHPVSVGGGATNLLIPVKRVS